jgi:signal transduction histidine kinase
VANTGPVIPPGDVSRLVQPFQRLGPDRTGHREGTGLGLSIVHAIATAHGAALSLWAPQDGGVIAEVSFAPGTDAPDQGWVDPSPLRDGPVPFRSS